MCVCVGGVMYGDYRYHRHHSGYVWDIFSNPPRPLHVVERKKGSDTRLLVLTMKRRQKSMNKQTS